MHDVDSGNAESERHDMRKGKVPHLEPCASNVKDDKHHDSSHPQNDGCLCGRMHRVVGTTETDDVSNPLDTCGTTDTSLHLSNLREALLHRTGRNKLRNDSLDLVGRGTTGAPRRHLNFDQRTGVGL